MTAALTTSDFGIRIEKPTQELQGMIRKEHTWPMANDADLKPVRFETWEYLVDIICSGEALSSYKTLMRPSFRRSKLRSSRVEQCGIGSSPSRPSTDQGV